MSALTWFAGILHQLSPWCQAETRSSSWTRTELRRPAPGKSHPLDFAVWGRIGPRNGSFSDLPEQISQLRRPVSERADVDAQVGISRSRGDGEGVPVKISLENQHGEVAYSW